MLEYFNNMMHLMRLPEYGLRNRQKSVAAIK
jgi:hypothetical protein